MSYCRWSSDNFKCDLYAYEDICGGYTIHIAARRYKEGGRKPIPKACFNAEGSYKRGESAEADRLWDEHWNSIDERTEEITLPFAGTTINLNTLEEMRDKMKELVAIGYKVPDYVFERIEDEIKENEDGRA